MGDLLHDLSLSDVIPSFAPSPSDSPSTVPANPNTAPVPVANSPGLTSIAASVPASIDESTSTTTSRDTVGGGGGSDDGGSSSSSSSGSTPPFSPKPPPTPNGASKPRNGTLSVQPKPAALVGTNGGTGASGGVGGASNPAKASGGTLNGLDGAASSAQPGAGVPIGAVLGGVLAGVIMVTLAVTLLVALRRKRSARHVPLDAPVKMRPTSEWGRVRLLEQGQKPAADRQRQHQNKQDEDEDDDVWTTRETPMLPPLQMAQEDTSSSLTAQFVQAFQGNGDRATSSDGYVPFVSPSSRGSSSASPSPVHASPSSHADIVAQRFLPSQQRPDSVGSITDAPMNYVVALEERIPRSNLRVMNRVSNVSIEEHSEHTN